MIARNRSRRRRGFTLVELLTVIAIIGLLVALAVGAYFRVRVSQEEAATETTLSKVHSQLDQQWRSVLDNARDQWVANDMNASSPRSIKWASLMAGGDPVRGKAILTKFKLKEEFPQTMWEALRWPYLMAGTSLPDGAGGSVVIAMQTNPAKYEQAIRKDLPTSTQPLDPSTLTADQQYLESAALLFLAVSRSRRGNAGFNVNEHVGSHAVGKVQLTSFPGKDFDVFVDTWGNPIGFVRWAFGGLNSDLNTPPNQQLNKLGQPVDSQDPEKTLYNTTWFNTTWFGGLTYGTVFMETLRHPLNQSGPLNLSPFVFSAGRDKAVGFKAVEGADNAAGQKHFESLNDGTEHDNVYSYRIKSGRGNN